MAAKKAAVNSKRNPAMEAFEARMLESVPVMMASAHSYALSAERAARARELESLTASALHFHQLYNAPDGVDVDRAGAKTARDRCIAAATQVLNAIAG